MPLTNSQYDKIMNIYDERLYRSNIRAAEQKRTLYEKLPELKRVDDFITDSYANLAISRVKGDTDGFAKAESALSEAKLKKKTLLLSAGLSEDAIMPTYECPDCRDTGFINGKKCHCFLRASIDLLYTQSGILDILQKENFNTFDSSLYPEDVTDPSAGMNARENSIYARDFSLDFTENFLTTRKGQNILFYGATGTGKTFLTHCIAKALIDKGISVIYLSAVRLFEIMADDHFGRTDSEGSAYVNSDLLESDLLIIDDLGTETVNNFTISALFELINERGLSNKSTVISANLDPKRIMDTYSERIFSRIAKDYRLIKLFGRDLRMAGPLHKTN